MLTQDDFPALVSEYKDRIFRVCLGFVKNPTDAEDLAQEVFIEAYLKKHQFRGKSRTHTWLYRIAVNHCLTHLRKQKRLKRSGKLTALELASHKAQDTFMAADSQIEQKEQFALLKKALDSIPEQQKVAFILRKIEALSPVEIAAIMHKSTAAVDALLVRAQKNLSEVLKKLPK